MLHGAQAQSRNGALIAFKKQFDEEAPEELRAVKVGAIGDGARKGKRKRDGPRPCEARAAARVRSLKAILGAAAAVRTQCHSQKNKAHNRSGPVALSILFIS